MCNATFDNDFGPASACGDFDFSLAFEQIVFIIGTSSLFLLAALLRLRKLLRESIKIDGLQYLYGAKTVQHPPTGSQMNADISSSSCLPF